MRTLTKPHDATSGAPIPIRTSQTSHNFTFPLRISHSWRLEEGNTFMPTGIRTASVPYESTPASLHIHTLLIHLPCYIQVGKAFKPSTNRSGRLPILSIRIHYVSCEPHFLPPSSTSTNCTVGEPA